MQSLSCRPGVSRVAGLTVAIDPVHDGSRNGQRLDNAANGPVLEDREQHFRGKWPAWFFAGPQIRRIVTRIVPANGNRALSVRFLASFLPASTRRGPLLELFRLAGYLALLLGWTVSIAGSARGNCSWVSVSRVLSGFPERAVVNGRLNY